MIEINNKTRSKINLKLVNKVTEDFLKLQKKKHDVSIVFVGDKIMRRLNKEYRGINKITDVLSFPALATKKETWVSGAGDGEKNFLGEIIIDYAKIKKQSRQFDYIMERAGGQATVYKNSAQKELIFILVHGLLHLLGYDDKTDKGRKKMEKLGTEFVLNYKL